MRWTLTCAVLFGCLASCSLAASAQDLAHTQWILAIKISEQTPGDAQVKILAEPTIAATAGRPFSYESAGTVKPRTGGGEFEVGTRVTGKLERADNGMVQIVVKIRMGMAVSQENDPMTELVRSETLEIRSFLRPGETKRLRCSASQWCEFRLADIK